MALKVHAVYQFADDSFAPKTLCGQPLPEDLLQWPKESRAELLRDFSLAKDKLKCATCVRLETASVGKHGRFRAWVTGTPG